MDELDIPFDIDTASAEELAAQHQRLDALAAAVRDRKILLDEALGRRAARDAAERKVASMGDTERQALTVALAGIPSAEAVQ